MSRPGRSGLLAFFTRRSTSPSVPDYGGTALCTLGAADGQEMPTSSGQPDFVGALAEGGTMDGEAGVRAVEPSRAMRGDAHRSRGRGRPPLFMAAERGKSRTTRCSGARRID